MVHDFSSNIPSNNIALKEKKQFDCAKAHPGKGCTALRKEPINRLLAVARNSSLNSSSTDMQIQEKFQNLKDSSKLGWEW